MPNDCKLHMNENGTKKVNENIDFSVTILNI